MHSVLIFKIRTEWKEAARRPLTKAKERGREKKERKKRRDRGQIEALTRKTRR